MPISWDILYRAYNPETLGVMALSQIYAYILRPDLDNMTTCHFAGDILNEFLNENWKCIYFDKVLMVQVVAWHCVGKKPLLEAFGVSIAPADTFTCLQLLIHLSHHNEIHPQSCHTKFHNDSLIEMISIDKVTKYLEISTFDSLGTICYTAAIHGFVKITLVELCK